LSEITFVQNRHTPDLLEAGLDEAGRGCLAGPVFAAAVILPDGFSHPKLNDSKQMRETDRRTLRAVIEREALAWAVATVSAEEIDRINILQASILAMHRAVEALRMRPEMLLVDGNRFRPFPGIAHCCFVKGDARFLSIAAASVLAKTHRDEHLEALHEQWPAYGWTRNKGYPTAEHRAAIAAHGPSPEHRMSFQLLPAPRLF
jgi:ribonuclease HII